MLIVDSSVWIDYFGRNQTTQAQQLDNLLMAGEQTIVVGDLILHRSEEHTSELQSQR